ncbi:hypothetical protein [Sphingomonas molluscorum]|uniref:hypothetical protein n=1 Tax=Sphingomonas molluscorum TaxID=418184 RepID=UPI0031E1A53C
MPLALACLASAADRMGVPLGLLPARLAPGAAIQTAREAFVSADPMAARARAAAAVAASPMDAGASALLGAVALKAGNPVAAHEAFAVSARLGWRNPAAQLYWLGVGLEAQDYALAAERLDALLRTGQRSAAIDAAILQLEASPGGRSALAAHLLVASNWREAFTASTGALSGTALARRIAVLQRARAGGMPVDCKAVAATVRTLVDRGDRKAASDLWRAACAPLSETESRAGNFETVAAARQPTHGAQPVWVDDLTIVRMAAAPPAVRARDVEQTTRS